MVVIPIESSPLHFEKKRSGVSINCNPFYLYSTQIGIEFWVLIRVLVVIIIIF